MAWRIEFAHSAERELAKLHPQTVGRVLRFLRDRVAPLDDPRILAKPLKGSRTDTYWRFRVGDYRIVALVEDSLERILIVRVAHRRDVYR